MNLASRMESTGEAGRIQISSVTAKLLTEAGKESWITPRDEVVVAKGKGELKTYWLLPDKQDTVSSYSSEGFSNEGDASGVKPDRMTKDVTSSFSPQTERTIRFHVDLLGRLLKHIAARRTHQTPVASPENFLVKPEECTVLDEVQDYIALPEIDDAGAKSRKVDPATIELNAAVKSQLHEFVSTLSCLYRNDNPFHNFEVSISVLYLLVVRKPALSC